MDPSTPPPPTTQTHQSPSSPPPPPPTTQTHQSPSSPPPPTTQTHQSPSSPSSPPPPTPTTQTHQSPSSPPPPPPPQPPSPTQPLCLTPPPSPTPPPSQHLSSTHPHSSTQPPSPTPPPSQPLSSSPNQSPTPPVSQPPTPPLSQSQSSTPPSQPPTPPPSQPLSSSPNPSPTPPLSQSQSSTPPPSPTTPPPSQFPSSTFPPSTSTETQHPFSTAFIPQQSPSSSPTSHHRVIMLEVNNNNDQVTMLEKENISATQEEENEIVPEQQESLIHHVGAPTSITPTTSIMQNQEQPQQQNFRQRAQIFVVRSRTFIIAVFLQFLFAILNLIAKLAIDDGMSSFVFVAYRSIIAFMVITPFAFYFEWNRLPKMTIGIFFRILALSLLGLLDQDLYLLGMKYTTATYATAMSNLLPVITFILACIRRTENINIRSRRHQAKVLGILLIVLGAMVMTMVKGFILFGTVGAINHSHHGGSHTIIGLMFILIGCLCFAYSSILQTIIINEYHYPALSLVSLISFLGSIEGILVALIVEGRTYYTIWTIFRWDLTLVSAIYAGIFCSGLGYYLEAVVMQARGPVYVSSFGPLCMIFVAFLEVFLLGEQLLLGRLIGAIVICVGLYCALWGRARDVTRTSQDAQDENHIR